MTKSTDKPNKPLSIANITTYQSGVIQSKTYRALNAYFAQCLKTHGLTTMQWFIIGTVYDAGEDGVRMSELASTLGSTLPTLTEATALLESKGWLLKNNHHTDGRTRMLTINPEKRETCMAIEQDLRVQLRKNIYSKVSQAELTAYVNVLYKLAGE